MYTYINDSYNAFIYFTVKKTKTITKASNKYDKCINNKHTSFPLIYHVYLYC